MPALNLEFDDDQIEVVRSAARRAGTSMRTFCKVAVLDRAAGRQARIEAIVAEVAARSSGLQVHDL
ncbi:hypothetical protein [Mycolicibacterium obuense]|uniref:Antitoxin Phd n=1 Tax=Mycolicibacterium obuense TaxID=1807 RepID=A0A0M2JWB5_9MYCO|nr:hypothetical protein [Mycolicibacterium obuense]KKE99199.1 hypothetical protein WN67_25310 [Mycolicibacterium obuense]OKH62002.1 hypothetical protein EB72_14300 [Mycobacterium sp. SWH-M1]